MIQALALGNGAVPRRRFAAVLLALVLNFALVPCTMAIEVVDEGHDCCPPELRLEAADCCEIDDGSVDTRRGTIDFDEDDASATASYVDLLTSPTGRDVGVADPPDPPRYRLDRNALYCVYLN